MVWTACIKPDLGIQKYLHLLCICIYSNIGWFKLRLNINMYKCILKIIEMVKITSLYADWQFYSTFLL